MKDTEIELQVQIEHQQPLVDFLKQGAEFESSDHQLDEYYTPAHRDFLAIDPIKEWFRLREADGKYSLNYKNWHYSDEGKGLYADEYETAIADASAARKMLAALNFKPIMKVDKQRQIWRYQDYEISLDTVEGLGDFVEIEYYGERPYQEHEAIVAEMIKFLKDLGCGAVELNHSGYPAMLLDRARRKDKVEII